MNSKILILLLGFVQFSFAQPFEFLLEKDSLFNVPTRGVYVDLDTYIAISYELDKIDTLKKQLPSVKEAFDSIKSASDSIVKAHWEHKETNETILKLERQSKQEVLSQYYNVKHNNTILRTDNKKLKDRNKVLWGITGSSVAVTIATIVVTNVLVKNKDP